MQEDLQSGTAIAAATGGPGAPGRAAEQDTAGGGTGPGDPPPSVVVPGSAAGDLGGSVAADRGTRREMSARAPLRSPWPAWARQQLEQALDVVRYAPENSDIPRLLHTTWFTPVVTAAPRRSLRRSIGRYRGASTADGWWRIRGGTHPPTRAASVQVLLTPRRGRAPAVVAAATDRLLDVEGPWSLACATRPQRLRRAGGVVLELSCADDLPEGLLERLAPLLLPVVPPLCLPIAPGAAIVGRPSGGADFGEHRCRLIATALSHPSSTAHPLRAVAAVFTAHGIDPSRPYR